MVIWNFVTLTQNISAALLQVLRPPPTASDLTRLYINQQLLAQFQINMFYWHRNLT